MVSPPAPPMMSSSTLKKGPTLGETAYRTLPNFYRTTIQLSTLLDVEQPLGHNDYRAVLELLGFTREEVRFWGCRCKRPTLEALAEWDGTVEELAGALRECERYDALSVLVQSLVQTLQHAHKQTRHTGTNILTEDAPSSSSILLPSTLRWEDASIWTQTTLRECKQTSEAVDAETSLSTSPSLVDKLYPDCVPEQSTTNSPSIQIAWGLPQARCSAYGTDTLPVTSPLVPKQDLEALLKSHFEIPAQIALTCVSSSNARKTTELVCNLVASIASRCRCISNFGDHTWISNTTVYVNNFARMLLMLVTFLNVVTCVFSEHHTPTYVLELIIAAIPVVQSFYVDQNLPVYRELIRRIKEVEAGMALITRTLERGPGRSTTSENNILRELDARKAKLGRLKSQVLPIYSDIRLCVISTLLLEVLLVFLILSVGLMCYTGEELLEKFSDGFTSMALALVCVDCSYNFAIVVMYYHDRTVETVLRKDRFRVNAALALDKSDFV